PPPPPPPPAPRPTTIFLNAKQNTLIYTLLLVGIVICVYDTDASWNSNRLMQSQKNRLIRAKRQLLRLLPAFRPKKPPSKRL
ncbi:electron transporter RnfC, partial [Escherichia coli]